MNTEAQNRYKATRQARRCRIVGTRPFRVAIAVNPRDVALASLASAAAVTCPVRSHLALAAATVQRMKGGVA